VRQCYDFSNKSPSRETGAPRSSEAPWAIQIVAVQICGGAALRNPTACRVALAPAFRPEPRNPQQGLGLTERRHAQIYARNKHIGRTQFCRDAVCHPVVGVVEPAAIPSVKTSGCSPEEWSDHKADAVGTPDPVFVIVSQPPSSQKIRPQGSPLKSKIWTASPVPSMNHAPSGTIAETAAPETAKDDNAMTSEAARAARRSHFAQRIVEPASAQPAPARLRHDRQGSLEAQR
jgi:hypothetical protein